MNISSLDVAYRKLIITKFFTKGWGSPDHIQKLFNMRKIISKRESCCKLVQDNYPIEKINEINKSDYRIINGKFRSPLADLLPGVVPEDVQEAYFQMILPVNGPVTTNQFAYIWQVPVTITFGEEGI